MRVRLCPALPGRREFPQRQAHCLQVLICQGRHPFHRHLPPLVPAGLGFPLEGKAGVGIRSYSQRGQLCLLTACQAWLPRARVSGCTGGRRDVPLCSWAAAPPPARLSSTPPSFPFPSYFASFLVCLHMCGGHACVHTCLWRLEGISCLQSPPTFPYCLYYWCV